MTTILVILLFGFTAFVWLGNRLYHQALKMEKREREKRDNEELLKKLEKIRARKEFE